MTKACVTNDTSEEYQKWPTTGILKDNINKTLTELKKVLRNEEGPVYAYILTTVEYNQSNFLQTGSAPNFQGGLLTLCTCKHYMRSWRAPADWKGVWVAGFTGINAVGDGKRYLFYLMKVEDAFESHKDLWDWLDPIAKREKSACESIFGDVYKPKFSLKEKFAPKDYYEPISKHVHEGFWYKDIRYPINSKSNRAALLVGSLSFSYLWDKPIIYINNNKFRTKKWDNIKDWLNILED